MPLRVSPFCTVNASLPITWMFPFTVTPFRVPPVKSRVVPLATLTVPPVIVAAEVKVPGPVRAMVLPALVNEAPR